MASKNAKKVLTEDEERKAQLELKIRKRVALEEKAHRIVERLLDNPIDPEFLIDCVRFIDPNHYQDVTEERATSQLCGYPVCQKYIKDVPKQQYRICLKTHKVYDITERKNFCSNRCYKASNFFKKQIPSSPVWARELEPPCHVSLLDEAINKGSVGEVVLANPAVEIHKEIKELERLDLASSHNTKGVYETQNKDVTVVSDLTEIFKNELNELKDNESSSVEVTTEQELSNRLSETFLLDEDETDDQNTENTEKKTAELHTEENRELIQDAPCDKYAKHVQDPGVSATSDHISTNNSRKNTKDKAELLMDMLDYRDSLQKGSKPREEKPTVDKFIEPNSIKGSDRTSSPLEPAVSKSTFTKVSAKSVYQNIQRVEQQYVTDMDSDDEISENDGSVLTPIEDITNCTQDMQFSTEKQTLKSPETQPYFTPYGFVSQILQEWKTGATVEYLTTANEETAQLKEKHVPSRQEAQANQLDSIDVTETEDELQKPRKKLPSMKELERETVQFDIKVKEFLKGKMSRVDDIERKGNEILEIQENDAFDPLQEIRLPLVDSLSQLALRRGIVLDQLHRALPDILGPMGMVVRDVVSDLRTLVYTFNLSNTNITMKPAEWTIMAFLLLKILCSRVPVLRDAMKTKSSVHFINTLTSSMGISEDHVEKVISTMTS